MTNPTDAAFRSFLTELSFRRHLRDLHRPASHDGDDSLPGQLKSASTSHGKQAGSSSAPDDPTRTASGSSAGASTATGGSTSAPNESHVSSSPAPFRFTNRVSISIRTPPYAFHSFGVFSIVAVPAGVAAQQPSTAAGSAAARKWLAEPSEHDALLAGVWFLGAFGRWWLMGAFRGLGDEKTAKTASEPASQLGVRDVKALDGSEDAVAAGASRQSLHAIPNQCVGADVCSFLLALDASAVLHKKGLDLELPPPYSHSPPPSPRQAQARLSGKPRPRSRRPSLDDSSGRPPPASAPQSPAKATPKTDVTPTPPSPLEPQNQPEPASLPSTVPLAPLDHPPSLSSLPQIDPAMLAANPPLAELHRELVASQASTADLLAQLSQSSAASQASQASLQLTIEELRSRKAQEDADRLEVKARTKTLEESKRQAEAAKREADKKCKHAESLRDAVLVRIAELTREMESARERMRDQQAEITASSATVARRESEIKAETAARRKKLALTEVRVGEMLHDVKELEGLVRYEEESLEHAKHDAVFQLEEARKLMASYSTYGSAGQFRPRTVESDLYTAHSQPPSNIVNASLPNPASSIFDLPIQQLPLSLLQRRRQPNEPSLAHAGANAGTGLSNSSSIGPNGRYGHTGRTASGSHLNDVFGFEDFGPGVAPRKLNRYSTPSRESLQASATASANPILASAPVNNQPYMNAPSHLPFAHLAAAEDSSEDDLLSSPNVMSASFTDLLPRGLFQSLTADGLLSPDPEKGALRGAHFDFHEEQAGSDDETAAASGSPTTEAAADAAESQATGKTLSDRMLPSSPRSVFSNDPRSFLLDGPESVENRTTHAASPQQTVQPHATSVFGHGSGPAHAPASAAALQAAAAHSALSDLSPNSMPFVPSLHGSNVNGGLGSARVSSESLVPPTLAGPPTSSYGASPGGGAGSRFFSSIRAFAPSAAERQALTRALRQNNGSNRSLDATDRNADAKHGPPPSPPASSTGGASFYASGPRLSQQRSASPFSTPHGSSSDLNRDLMAAAAWDAPPARPSLDETRTRTKSFRCDFPYCSRYVLSTFD